MYDMFGREEYEDRCIFVSLFSSEKLSFTFNCRKKKIETSIKWEKTKSAKFLKTIIKKLIVTIFL